MTTIYLIRHAEAEGNLYRIAQGHLNGTITDRGYLQIKALQKRFEPIHIDAVYSSDLRRACITARAICKPKGLPLHRVPDFREVNMGVWEGRTWQELRMDDEEQLYYFNRDLSRWQVEGCETCRDVLSRFIPALRRVAAENEGKTIAVFSHGAATRMVLGTLQGVPMEELGQTPHGDNTSVSLLEVENNEIRVVYRDDNSHLTQAGLSTFARQSWWKDKYMKEDGEYYRPMTDEYRAELKALGVEVPEDGICCAIRYGFETIGLYQLLPEKDNRYGWIGCYWLAPAWRGKNLGIPPLGQAVIYYRRRGVDYLRLHCPDEASRGFFMKFGFYPAEGDILEKYIGYGDDAE